MERGEGIVGGWASKKVRELTKAPPAWASERLPKGLKERKNFIKVWRSLQGTRYPRCVGGSGPRLVQTLGDVVVSGRPRENWTLQKGGPLSSGFRFLQAPAAEPDIMLSRNDEGKGTGG